MATQGVVSVRRGGTMELKIVVGIEGYRAGKMADAICKFTLREGRLPTANETYQLAARAKFGNKADRVVVSRDEIIYEGDDDPRETYRKTFRKPRWNPRWDHGTADYVIVLDI